MEWETRGGNFHIFEPIPWKICENDPAIFRGIFMEDKAAVEHIVQADLFL